MPSLVCTGLGIPDVVVAIVVCVPDLGPTNGGNPRENSVKGGHGRMEQPAVLMTRGM